MKERYFFAVLFILIIFLGFFVKNPFILNMLSLSAITLIVVTGLNLLLGFAGQISLGHAGFVALGAYISAIASVKFGVNPWIAILIAVFATEIFAIFIGYPTLKLKSHYLAMATLAIGEIINIVTNAWVEATGGPQGFVGIPLLSVFGFALDNEVKFYFFIWSLTFILIFLSINLIDSKFGRALKTIKSKENAAYAFGINVHLYKMIVFLISVFYAALAGGLYAFYIGFISPSSFGLTESINYITMIVVGGMGNFVGVFISSVILSILPNLFASFEDYWPIINGLLLIFVIMFTPNGLKDIFKWTKKQ